MMTVLYVRCAFLGMELISAQLVSVDPARSQHARAAISTEGLSQIFLHHLSLKWLIMTVLDLHQTYEDLYATGPTVTAAPSPQRTGGDNYIGHNYIGHN